MIPNLLLANQNYAFHIPLIENKLGYTNSRFKILVKILLNSRLMNPKSQSPTLLRSPRRLFGPWITVILAATLSVASEGFGNPGKRPTDQYSETVPVAEGGVSGKSYLTMTRPPPLRIDIPAKLIPEDPPRTPPSLEKFLASRHMVAERDEPDATTASPENLPEKANTEGDPLPTAEPDVANPTRKSPPSTQNSSTDTPADRAGGLFEEEEREAVTGLGEILRFLQNRQARPLIDPTTDPSNFGYVPPLGDGEPRSRAEYQRETRK